MNDIEFHVTDVWLTPFIPLNFYYRSLQVHSMSLQLISHDMYQLAGAGEETSGWKQAEIRNQ